MVFCALVLATFCHVYRLSVAAYMNYKVDYSHMTEGCQHQRTDAPKTTYSLTMKITVKTTYSKCPSGVLLGQINVYG